MMKYHFKYYPEKVGYYAKCIELEGCRTEGDTWNELYKNMQDALNLFLDEPDDSKEMWPLPKKNIRSKNIIEVPVDEKVAFAFMMRRQRLLNNMTQREVAKKLGLKNLFSYQRLESSKKANPALKTIAMVKKIFPDMSIDEILNT